MRAAWDAAQAAWLVDTTAGRFKAQVLISAAGHLSDPSFPDIEGWPPSGARVFHSANWDHSYDPAGKRIGVIGTGASAIQIVPELARDAGQLTVFQRSAPYVIPRRVPCLQRRPRRGLFARFPEAAQELRDELFWGNESRFPQRRQVPAFIEQVTAMALSHLRKQVPDELRAQLTPITPSAASAS